MTGRQALQAAEVLRQHAPHQTHEVRHACHEAIAFLGRVHGHLDTAKERTVDRQTMDVITAPTRSAAERALDCDTLGSTEVPVADKVRHVWPPHYGD